MAPCLQPWLHKLAEPIESGASSRLSNATRPSKNSGSPAEAAATTAEMQPWLAIAGFFVNTRCTK